MDPSSQLVTALLGYGPAGIAIIALGFACLTLYKRNESLNDAMREIAVNAATAQQATNLAINRLADIVSARQGSGT